MAAGPQAKRSSSQRKARVTLALPGIRDLVIDGTADVVVTAEYLGSAQAYPLLAGLQPDLYRCFMEQTWRHMSSARGVVTLIHPETHFTDEKAGLLREAYVLSAASALAVHQRAQALRD